MRNPEIPAPFLVGMWNAEKGQDGEDEGTGKGMMKKSSQENVHVSQGHVFSLAAQIPLSQRGRGKKLRNSLPRNAGPNTSPLPGPLADEVRNPFLEDFFLMLENLPSKQHSNK